MIHGLLGKSVFFFLLCLFSTRGRVFKGDYKFGDNFINIVMRQGFKELRIAFKGILVLETSAFQNTSYELHFRQMTNGRELVQLIFQEGSVKDCEYSRDPKQVLNFVQEFSLSVDVFKPNTFNEGDAFYLYKTGDLKNGTSAINHFDRRKDLREFKSFVNIKTAKKMCNKLVDESFKATDKYNSFDYIHIGKIKQKSKGKKLHSKRDAFIEKSQLIPHVKEGGKRNMDASLNIEHHRRKRDVINRFLMFPGTKWCGRGQTALHYDDIGEDREADVCCRDHDCCPDLIPSFSSRFNVFNYRFHAVLHCDCDDQFRWCLKQSYSPMADLIGRIYFNIMGSRCFTLKTEYVCTERSWWGYCLKYDNQSVATIKSQEFFGYY